MEGRCSGLKSLDQFVFRIFNSTYVFKDHKRNKLNNKKHIYLSWLNNFCHYNR